MSGRLPALVLAGLLAVGIGAASDEASAGDARVGAGLYRTAVWRGGTISGAIEGGPSLPRRRLACGGCHGAEPGLAAAVEGGLDIPVLSGASLARRGLIDAGSLAGALATGELPDGTRLARSMPRFRLPLEAAADLLDYLRAPEAVDAPGVMPQAVRLGLLAPAPLAARILPALRAWADGLNAEGGVWGRRVVLDVLPAEPAALARHLDATPPLAVVAGGATLQQAELLIDREVMELAPLAPLGGISAGRGRVVALGPGLVDMATALARELGRQRAGPRAAPLFIVEPERVDEQKAVREALRPILAMQPLSAAALLRAEAATGADAVLLLARPPVDALRRLPRTALVAGPIDFLADLVGDPDNPDRWLLADPRGDTLPDPTDATALQRHILAAARLVETGLTRAGRRLTRGSLMAALAARPVDLGGKQAWQAPDADGRRPVQVAIVEADATTGRLERLPEPESKAP